MELADEYYNYMNQMNQTVILEEAPLDPELARTFDQFVRNLRWFNEHATELDVFNRFRGRHIAVAGGELFVGDSPDEVVGLANVKYPDDHPFIHYIPKEKVYRIYDYPDQEVILLAHPHRYEIKTDV